MEVKPAVFALLYGDHFDLHERLLTKLKSTLPPEVTALLWCNQVCTQTKRLILTLGDQFHAFYSDENNVPKYKAMRQMFSLAQDAKLDYNWVVWFDDDTQITKSDWFSKTVEFLTRNQDASYLGQQWFVHHLPGQKEFIESGSWFKGKPFELIKGKPGVRFAQGSYWWLRVDALHKINWPDGRLSHNGGDTLLGEALRQNGYPLTAFWYGVKPNDAKRRGLSEAPAGSAVNCRR